MQKETGMVSYPSLTMCKRKRVCSVIQPYHVQKEMGMLSHPSLTMCKRKQVCSVIQPYHVQKEAGMVSYPALPCAKGSRYGQLSSLTMCKKKDMAIILLVSWSRGAGALSKPYLYKGKGILKNGHFRGIALLNTP